MLGSGSIRTGIAPGGLLAPNWSQDRLLRLAGSRPSFDLRFAETKSLIDFVSKNSLVTFTRASAGTYFNSEGILTTATTNFFLRSEEFGTLWEIGRGSILTNAHVAPNGSLTADKFIEDNSIVGSHFLQQLRTYTAGLTYTASFYAKAGERAEVAFFANNSSVFAINARFNLSTGTIVSNPLGTARIESVGDGWYRCSITGIAGTSAGTNVGWNLIDETGATSYLGDGVSGLFLWGAQLEQSSTVGEYIPTTSTINSAPRFNHNPTTGESLGLLIEAQVTNNVLHNRTLTNAAWVATNITAAKNQTGIDGASNSASSITATSANGTILQTLTLASASRITSAFVRRLTGVGAIQFTQDGGATWTNVDVSNNWTRVNTTTATLANPVVGFRIATSGDSIAVDYVQNELNNQITSPIETGGAAVIRSADVCLVSGSNLSSFFIQDQGSWFCEVNSARLTTTASPVGFFGLDTNTFGRGHAIGTSATRMRSLRRDAIGGPYTADSLVAGLPSPTKVALFTTLSEQRMVSNNTSIQTNNTVISIDPITHLRIGLQNVAGAIAEAYLNGCISRLCYWPVKLNDARLLQITR